MPYVRCLRCGLNTFSVARWSNVDRCERCDAELPRDRSGGSPPDELRGLQPRHLPAPGRGETPVAAAPS